MHSECLGFLWEVVFPYEEETLYKECVLHVVSSSLSTRSHHQRSEYPVSSAASMNSDWSMGRPIHFNYGHHSTEQWFDFIHVDDHNYTGASIMR